VIFHIDGEMAHVREHADKLAEYMGYARNWEV
jgi:hypothetical protein